LFLRRGFAMPLNKLTELAIKNNTIQKQLYDTYEVKRGLRNRDGSGVLVGLTEIGDVHGYIRDEQELVPVEGRLSYRGIDIKDIIDHIKKEKRSGFEEVVFLLLFGELPGKNALKTFTELLNKNRELPAGFTENMILKAPSKDIMNKLARSVLVCYSYDKNPDDISIRNVLRQCVELIAKFPTMTAYGYQAKAHYHNGKSLFIHNPKPHLNTAENFLHMIRPDSKYSRLEAETLDISLILHAEHGGGNNSSFTTHVVTSTDTDTYSAIAAAVGALKGPKHGGANIKVINMMRNIKQNVKNWENSREVENYLVKILRKEAYDKTGLIYGMGHAVYTLSDPRAVILKQYAAKLAKEKNREKEFNLYAEIEKVSVDAFKEIKKTNKVISANVDFYSGFVYDMLGIPVELFTPIFAMARVSGWCAHRIEELISGGKIIRPAYKSVADRKEYIPLNKRK
jgi:citrate synthase